MDMRNVVKDLLYNLANDEESILRMKEELKSLEAQFCAIRAARTDGTPVSGGNSGRNDWMENNMQQREYLEWRIKEKETRTKSIREAINGHEAGDGVEALEGMTEEQKRILDVFFIHKRTNAADDLAAEFNQDRSTIFRKQRAALSELTRRMYGGNEV